MAMDESLQRALVDSTGRFLDRFNGIGWSAAGWLGRLIEHEEGRRSRARETLLAHGVPKGDLDMLKRQFFDEAEERQVIEKLTRKWRRPFSTGPLIISVFG